MLPLHHIYPRSLCVHLCYLCLLPAINMRPSSLQAFVLVAVFASAPTAYAWGAAGHEIVATIAQIHLPKPVLETVCDILNSGDSASSSSFSPAHSHTEASPPCHLAPIAAWADQIRGKPQYRYTAPMHYINALDDLPADSCAFPGPQGWHGRPNQNVLSALGNVSHVLRGFAAGDQSVGAASEALKFFVHWVGDMHQPLHMSGREKGGNGARVAWNGRVTSACCLPLLTLSFLLHAPPYPTAADHICLCTRMHRPS